jgi:hypothetical protein
MSMTKPAPDDRTSDRRTKDEQIAAESPLAPLVVAPGARSKPVEHHFASQRRPIAVTGVVENGLVRPLDPTVKLSERSRVIIVASEEQ